MANDFQIWLKSKGYYRKKDSLLWYKDGKIVSGRDLGMKLRKYKALANES